MHVFARHDGHSAGGQRLSLDAGHPADNLEYLLPQCASVDRADECDVGCDVLRSNGPQLLTPSTLRELDVGATQLHDYYKCSTPPTYFTGKTIFPMR